MRLEHIIPQLHTALQLDTPLALDENQQLCLTFDRKWDVVLRLDQVNNDVLIYLPVYELTENMLERIAVLHLLNMQFALGCATAGCAFGYVAELKSAVIWRHYRNYFEDADDLIAVISRILDIANNLVARIPELEAAADDFERNYISNNGEPQTLQINLDLMRILA